VLQFAVLSADVSPDPLHSVDGLAVMGDEIVASKKNIELTRRELQRLGVKHHAMDHCVDVVAPVVNLGNMHLAQGIVNGQGMKAKRVAQRRLYHRQRLRVKVHPQHACLVVQGSTPFCGGQINSHIPRTTAIKGAQHGKLPVLALHGTCNSKTGSVCEVIR
jgi:hypothetical protein